jgi:hypothetical protein
MPLMELHILKDMVFVSPWPEDLDQLFMDAQDYSSEMSKINAHPEIITAKYKDTVSIGVLHVSG